jgi:hypothetical protein
VRYGALPQSPPLDPYSLDRQDPNCTPEAVASANALVRVVKAVSTRIEARRATDGHYPASFDIDPVAGFDGVLKYLPGVNGGFALTIEPKRLNTLGIACIRFGAAGERSDAASAGAIFDSASRRAIEFYFSPRFGFYVVFGRGTVVSNVGSPTTTRPPDIAPLAVRPNCPVSQRPLVESIVQRLGAQASSPRSPQLANGVTLTRREASAVRWVEIGFADPLAEAVFAGCTYVAPLKPGTIPAGGKPKPGLIYVESIGLLRVE